MNKRSSVPKDVWSHADRFPSEGTSNRNYMNDDTVKGANNNGVNNPGVLLIKTPQMAPYRAVHVQLQSGERM